ncbi:helix-turn-helix transcriptional regulator [Rhizobium sp. P32RR-XVIII]|uniref:helix-turn-helix domain-containing protein n=1 Tax=Rhizobium sp. P32RR-XVIII TaxID=2726738 RepID=UPI001456773E|nr:helix-turn-helix transcriptional regulator [Rhizobium sp. P32RR-XVIII]NLS04608.1 helix-turn-helix transcriptional regulator [Rhizobium sp. P32RR-XVIII]
MPRALSDKERERAVAWIEVLRELIEEHGTSAVALATAINIKPKTLAGALSGENVIALTTLEAALAYFGYELEAIKVGRPVQHVATGCNEDVD